MAYSALDAAWAKYNRAARELLVLRRNVGVFLAADPYGVDFRFDESAGCWIGTTVIREEPPPHLGVAVGAVAHQLLSGLNHIVWALAVRKLGEARAQAVRSQLDFPIFESPGRFKKARMLPHVSKKAAAVLEGLQPYHRGRAADGRLHHPLLLVKELANADKHRVLASSYGTVGLGPVLSGESIHYDERAVAPRLERTLPERKEPRMLGNGTELVRVFFEQHAEQADLRLEFPLQVELAFQSDSWGGITLRGVGDMVATVDRCMTRLASLFPDHTWPPASHDTSGRFEW